MVNFGNPFVDVINIFRVAQLCYKDTMHSDWLTKSQDLEHPIRVVYFNVPSVATQLENLLITSTLGLLFDILQCSFQQ